MNKDKNEVKQNDKKFRTLFVCNWKGCKKSYSQKSHLTRHQSSAHDIDYDIKDNKRDSEKSDKQDEEESEEEDDQQKNDRSFVCDLKDCTKSYTRNLHLKRHKEREHKMNSLACNWPECKYIAKHMTHLNDHIKIHTGDKKYSWYIIL